MATQVRSRYRPPSWMITLGVLIVVVVIASFNVKVVSGEQATADAAPTFDSASFAVDQYSSVIAPQIEEDAVDLSTLLTDLAAGADEADFGNTSGSSSAYAFPVTFTAVAGELTPPTLALTVDGVPEGTTVVMQVGPALSGTAIRDVTGTISFNQFVNQSEYQNVGTELNNQVRENVLNGLDVASLPGKTLTVTGAFLRVNPALVSVVPVKIEVQP
jgi:predicted lipoprotein